MALALVGMAMASSICVGQTPDDAELAVSFKRVVFGSEFASASRRQNEIVKKFTGPVRFHIDDRSPSSGSHAEVRRFLASLSGKIPGLRTSITADPRIANFRVLLVRRADYQRIVEREVFKRREARFAPGECLVRIVASPAGIIRSDAVIVTDAADGLFRKCLIAEVLQGLGPINDDSRLKGSVFNDKTRIESFTNVDRTILNILYHPAIRAGMNMREVDGVLPDVFRDLRQNSGIR